MIIVVTEIILSPISFNAYSTFFGGIICLSISTVSIYLIKRLNQPKISLLGFITSSVIIFTFLSSYGNVSILFFIITQIFIIYIIIILRRLKKGNNKVKK